MRPRTCFRHNQERSAGVGRRILVCQPVGDHPQGGPGLLDGHRGSEAPEDRQSFLAARFEHRDGPRFGVRHDIEHGDRHEAGNADKGIGTAEARSRDAHHRERPTVDANRAADDRRVAGEPPLPVVVGQHEHRRVARHPCLAGRNQAAGRRPHAEHREVVVGHGVDEDALGPRHRRSTQTIAGSNPARSATAVCPRR